MDAGELALGPKGFKEYAGHFWGFLETRPYMRARAGLAGTLLKLGAEDAAIRHYRDMLKLNPNDNQGIRYVLAALLLRRGEEAELKELLAVYEDEVSAYWLYTFREGGEDSEQAVTLVKDDWSANEHVPAILVGTNRPSLMTAATAEFVDIVGCLVRAAHGDVTARLRSLAVHSHNT